jgi:hypothetical protein
MPSYYALGKGLNAPLSGQFLDDKAHTLTEEKPLSKDATQKLFAYIALLEETNEQLVTTLKMCVELLSQFNSTVFDPESWQEMLDAFNDILKAAQRTIEQKTLH